MTVCRRQVLSIRALAAFSLFCLASLALPAQQLDQQAVIRQIDASVQARIDGIASYSVNEHYAVYRNSDETHPVAEMMVRTDYKNGSGKTYTTLSQSGSSLVRSQVLGRILENEKIMSLPDNRRQAVVTSANYEMKLKSDQKQTVDGRECLVLSLTPRRTSPFLFNGTLWVDSRDYSIVQLQGMAAKSHSMLTGPAQVARQYANVDGFPMATHARALSNSFLLGQTIVKIDYQGYQIQTPPTK
jgi:outer membrane lipoprotein-sorting protein